ncbi:MAG: hypothetical protein VXV97_09295, partial [Pseudomonadota bacterium]|nr:hypothetical protein [Pseudomonadota bacterium]
LSPRPSRQIKIPSARLTNLSEIEWLALILSRYPIKLPVPAKEHVWEHLGSVSSVNSSPDSKIAVTGSCKEGRAYSVEDGKQLNTFKPKRLSYVIIAAVTPDGKSAFTGAGDRTTPEWDLKTGEMVREWATGRMSKISTSRPAADGTLPQPPRSARRSFGIDRPARKSSRCHILEPCSRWILYRTA